MGIPAAVGQGDAETDDQVADAKYSTRRGRGWGSQLIQSSWKSIMMPKKKPTTKLNRYSGTNRFRRIIDSAPAAPGRYRSRSPWGPGEKLRKCMGTLEMAGSLSPSGHQHHAKAVDHHRQQRGQLPRSTMSLFHHCHPPGRAVFSYLQCSAGAGKINKSILFIKIDFFYKYGFYWPKGGPL